MNDLRREFAVNTAYSGLATYLEYGAALLSSVVIARHLGAEEYGTYTLWLWMTSAGVVLANHGLITGVMKFVGEARGRGSAELVAGVLRRFERVQLVSTAAVTGVAAAVIASGAGRVSAGAADRVLWALLPAIALRSLYVYYSSVARGFEDFRAVWSVQLLVAPATVLVAAMLALRGAMLVSFAWAYAGLCLLSAIAMGTVAHRRWAVAPQYPLARNINGRIRRHVVYASAIILLELVILRQTELVFLDWFSTREHVAYYGLGRSLAATALLLIPGTVTALLLPLMSRTYGEHPARLRGRFLAMARYLCLLTMPVVVLGEVFGESLIAAFYGPEYRPAAVVFRVAIAAGAIGVVSASASSYQLGTDRQAAIVAIMATVAVITLTLDYVLIRAFGLPGAIAAGAAGGGLLGAGLLWHACATLAVTFDWRTSVKIVIAGGIALIPVALLARWLPLPVALPAGMAVFAAVYLPLTVVLGAWTHDDLHWLRALDRRLPSRLGKPAAALVHWAARVGARPAAD